MVQLQGAPLAGRLPERAGGPRVCQVTKVRPPPARRQQTNDARPWSSGGGAHATRGTHGELGGHGTTAVICVVSPNGFWPDILLGSDGRSHSRWIAKISRTPSHFFNTATQRSQVAALNS